MCPAKSYRSDLRSRASQPNCASPSASFCFDEKKDTSNTLHVEKELKGCDRGGKMVGNKRKLLHGRLAHGMGCGHSTFVCYLFSSLLSLFKGIVSVQLSVGIPLSGGVGIPPSYSTRTPLCKICS